MEPWVIKYDPEKCTQETRWMIPAFKTIRLFIKYYSTVVNQHSTRLQFESLQ